jgi:hypothetical protein
MSGTRIVWREDERARVAEGMKERLRVYPRATVMELWEAGNERLLPDRRRKWYSSYSGNSGIEAELFRTARVSSGASGGEPAMHVPQQVESEVTWVPVPTPQPISELPFELLLTEVITRLIARLTPVVAPRETKPVYPMAPLADVAPKEHKVERPVRIALCGPLKDQFNRVKEQINARKVELVLVDNQKEVNPADWKAGIEYAIVTRFIRHTHSESANKVVGRERVLWSSQGTDAIVAKISEVVPGCLN